MSAAHMGLAEMRGDERGRIGESGEIRRRG